MSVILLKIMLESNLVGLKGKKRVTKVPTGSNKIPIMGGIFQAKFKR